MQLGFIGTGEITLSIVTGLSSSGVTTHSIWLSPRNSAVANGLANRFHGITVAFCNQEVLEHSDTIVIAVRPSVARDVLFVGGIGFLDESNCSLTAAEPRSDRKGGRLFWRDRSEGPNDDIALEKEQKYAIRKGYNDFKTGVPIECPRNRSRNGLELATPS